MARVGANLTLARLGVLLVFLTVIPVFLPEILVVQAVDILVFTLFAVSLNLLVGYTGMLSLGHAAYFAIGAYGAAIMFKYGGLPMPMAFAAAPFMAAVAAAVIGFFCIRLTHAYFIMLTLAFGQLVYAVVWKWREVTGGDDGLTGILPTGALAGSLAYYYFTLVVVAASIAVFYQLSRSPFGSTLKAIKDNPRRVEFIGVNVKLHQLTAFTIAGFFAGVAGALHVFFNRGVFPGVAHWLNSADALVMVVLGGANHFAGPILGAVLFKILAFVIPRYTHYWLFVLGAILLAVALVMPHGLMGVFQRRGFRGGTG
jgi:branched-chain amino acid transport system permease protein